VIAAFSSTDIFATVAAARASAFATALGGGVLASCAEAGLVRARAIRTAVSPEPYRKSVFSISTSPKLTLARIILQIGAIPQSFQNVAMIAGPIMVIQIELKAKACSSCPAFNRTG
jgi:hypothetical protein